MNKNQPKVLEWELWPVDKLRPNDYNPNIMDEKTMALTQLSMEEEGFSDPIDIDPTGMILDGEHRWLIAKKLGMKEVPVFIKERYGDDAVITTIRKDRTHGEPDLVKLAEIVGYLIDEVGSEEVERRLGYGQDEQTAFLEVDRFDWASYGTEDEDAAQLGREEDVTWSIGLDSDTRLRLESLMAEYGLLAAQTKHGDSELGRFVALVADARKRAGIPDGAEVGDD